MSTEPERVLALFSGARAGKITSFYYAAGSLGIRSAE